MRFSFCRHQCAVRASGESYHTRSSLLVTGGRLRKSYVKSDIYQLVTDRIIALLEAGTVPWRKPWSGYASAPQNLVSRKAYRGINLLLLHAAGFASPFWLTFRQAQELGGRVKKGEKSFPVVFWKLFEDDEHGEPRTIPFIRYHSVFNVAQCEGIECPLAPVPRPEFQPIGECEQVVSGMPKAPVIAHGFNRACYSPIRDSVEMPDRAAFSPPEEYYSVLFHELTHATGHPTRLGRKGVAETNSFGSDPYSREELVAEMGAAFLCGHCGIGAATIDQSASYIENWLTRLKNDRKLVIKAAADAQKAADFILNVPVEPKAPLEYQPKEFAVTALRECPTPSEMQLCETPQAAADYWRMHVATSPQFNPDCECFVVLFLNIRKRIKGHQLVSIGTVDCTLIHPRETFRAAIGMAASSIVVMHNHPSGEPFPSDADIRSTKELIQAGQILKMEVLDHVIVGNRAHFSLREAGHFNA